MTFIDLFAGVGGFRKGLELAGHKCIGFCEYDKYAIASYTSMHLLTEEQRKYLSGLSKSDRQKEILNEEYRNGEWFARDIREVRGDTIPKADCWTFGSPCQSFSLAGCRTGLGGESGLIREVFRILAEQKEDDRPEWLIHENVKGEFTSNKGFDYLAVLSELDALGYDAEWCLFDSKNFRTAQSRERVYTVGHLRTRGSKHIFPLEEADRQVSSQTIKQVGQRNTDKRKNLNQYRVYDPSGLAPCLNKMEGGGREPHIIVPVGFNTMPDGTSRTIKNQYQKNNSLNFGASTGARAASAALNLISGDKGDDTITVIAKDGKPFQAFWNDKLNSYIAIRKLTPKECFRLQSWSDDYFERAEFVNSNSQLFKQAGNGVTVNVVQAIGEALNIWKTKS